MSKVEAFGGHTGQLSEGAGERSAGGCPLHGLIDGLRMRGRAARLWIVVYGLATYAVFFGTFLYGIGFVTGVGVPTDVRSGDAAPLGMALLVNTLLLSVFAVQHTVMARAWFKQWVVRVIPEAIERSTFVLLASVSLLLIFLLWQPLPQVVWSVSNPIVAAVLSAASFVGFGIVLYSSFLIDHFELFGLRQILAGYRRSKLEPTAFRLRGLYRIVRHPMMLGFLIAVWATPTLTVGHLFLALMTTGYIIVGTAIEERDLVEVLGSEYTRYQARVRALMPLPRRFGAAR